MSSRVDSAELAVIETLVEHHDTGLTADELAEASGVPRATVYRLLEPMAERELIITVGWAKRAKLYSLNVAHPEVADIAGALADFARRTTDREMEARGIVCEPLVVPEWIIDGVPPSGSPWKTKLTTV